MARIIYIIVHSFFFSSDHGFWLILSLSRLNNDTVFIFLKSCLLKINKYYLYRNCEKKKDDIYLFIN
jgi:hypothetical protein